jgi:thiamine pyrophosphokinase
VDLDVAAGTTVSFFAVGAPAEGVTTENFRYALAGRRLELGVQDSVSNITTARPARIRIARGQLLVFVVTRP